MPLKSDRLREFLKSEEPGKRSRLVEELIVTPQFERRLATFLDVTLMERRAYKDVSEEVWTSYLLESVRQNRPWNELAAEILSADGIDDSRRAAVRFALAREAEPNLLTRDIGRIFFGRDLQCAQCHNHPLVTDYLQSDYQGMLAFVAPGFVKTVQKPGPKDKDGKPGKPVPVRVYAEKDGNDIGFESVFVKDTKHRTGPRLIGEKSILEPDQFPVAETTLDRPSPSRRNVLAEKATDGTNRAFNENMANRLWSMMMGRGLVHPPDFHHRDNPPLKPELMRTLGEQFAAMDFDMRSFLKEIALSEVYQRAYELPPFQDSTTAIEERLRTLQERKKNLDLELTAVQDAYDRAGEVWGASEAALIPVALEVEKQRQALVTAQTEISKLKSALDAARATSVRDAAIQQHLADSSNRLKLVSARLGDTEFAQLSQQLDAKLKKVAAASQESARKTADAENQLKAGEEKVAASREALTAGYAKRQPLRVDFDQKEAEVRLRRDDVEKLISERGAVESEIATLEKLVEYNLLVGKLQAAGADPSGEPVEELRTSRLRLEDSLSVRLSQKHVVSSLRPLSPEQLAWTTMRVTGFYERYLTAEEAKLRKEQGIAPEIQLGLEQARLVEERTHQVLKGHVNNFVRFYAAGAGQPQGDFFATADQALFAANSGSINSYVGPAADNVTERLLKAPDIRVAAEELYLAILSRMPEPEEVSLVESYLGTDGKDKRQAVMELAWSLINSAEFRFNH